MVVFTGHRCFFLGEYPSFRFEQADNDVAQGLEAGKGGECCHPLATLLHSLL
jgi:hypothetical protein